MKCVISNKTYLCKIFLHTFLQCAVDGELTFIKNLQLVDKSMMFNKNLRK